MIGDWRDDWDMLQALQGRLEEIYRSRAGGSVEAQADLLAFFERSEALRDRARLELAGTPKQARIDAVMRQTLALQLAHDVAIKSKHGKQDEPPWAGDVGGDVVSQSVSVFIGTGQSAHYWRITYTPHGAGPLGKVSIDALVLSQEVLASWRTLLVDVRLLD